MNRLSTEKRAQILGALVEGNSIRATVRMTGAAKNTITKLLADVGYACTDYQDKVLRDLSCDTLQCDEIWSFCYSKQKNIPKEHVGTFGYGDCWTWTAIDADTKLVPAWLVGERTPEDAHAFLTDLYRRLDNRVQLTTDGLHLYLKAVNRSFGSEIDYAMLQKLYGGDAESERRYSPAVCIGTETRVVKGAPDPAKISTSYVERQNLTMRMGLRRFTRLTNPFSKKIENLAWAVSLHFMHYNFARPHKTLTKRYPTTPAMAAGVADHVWTMEEIAGLLNLFEKREAA
ncbi:MAG: IS1 family transposase [Solirubrobacterales bacterium]